MQPVVNYYSAANIMIENSSCTLRTSILLVYFFSNFVFTLKKDARLAAATREKTSTLPCIQILSKKTAVNTTQPQYCPLSFLDFKCIAPPPLIWISGLFPDLVFVFTTDTVTTKFSKTSHFWFFFFPWLKTRGFNYILCNCCEESHKLLSRSSVSKQQRENAQSVESLELHIARCADPQ